MPADLGKLTLAVDSIGGTAIRAFFYVTADTRSTVLSDGYFNGAKKRGISANDLIYVADLANPGTTYDLRVESANDNTGSVVVKDAVKGDTAFLDYANQTETRAGADVDKPVKPDGLKDAIDISKVVYASVVAATAFAFVGDVKSVQTQFYSPTYPDLSTLVGGASYSRMSKAAIDAAGYPALSYFRSADRFMPDGTTVDNTDGGYWLLNEIEPNIFALGAKASSGFDSLPAIQGAIDYLKLRYGRGVVTVPPGQFFTSDQIELPAVVYNSSITIKGSGREASVITPKNAFAAGKAVIYRSAAAGTIIGGGIVDVSINANRLSDYAIYIETGKGFSMRGSSFTNALVTEGLFGSVSVPRFYEADWFEAWFYTASNVPGITKATLPDYNVHLIGYATDNELFRVTASNAKLRNILIEPGGNALFGSHLFGSPGTLEADFCAEFLGPTRSIGNYYDGFAVDAVRFGPGSSGTSSIGDKLFWPSTTTGDAFTIATGLSNIIINGTVYSNKPSARAKIVYEGTLPTSSQILENVFYADGTNVIIGHTNTLGFASGARLQLYGTGFADSMASVARFSADSSGPFVRLLKSRATTIAGARAIVSISDIIGSLEWAADDGANAVSAARITARVDGTPGIGDMPGRLEFSTTSDGASSVTERLRIRNDGTVSHRADATVIIDANSHLGLRSYTVATVPSASTAARQIFVSDGTSNKRFAVSDGTNWRWPDGAIVS